MKHDEFIGQVQSRARLATRGDAERATRATFETLAERLAGGEAKDLGAQLPQELGRHLMGPESGKGERFSLDGFFDRVQEREGVDMPIAVHHARAVVSVLNDAVSQGEIRQVRDQLGEEFSPLFEAGSEGEMRV